MARKTSKENSTKGISSKKHSSIPPSATISATPRKKAAETVTPAAISPSGAAPAPAPVIDRAAVAAQIAALRGTDADTARDAAIALGRLGDASAVAPLIEALGNDNGYFHCVVRAAAAASLGQLRDPRAFEPLAAATSDTMAEASAEAVRALVALADPRATAVLIDIVRNPQGYFLSTVRLAAVEGLKKLGGPAATAELAQVAGDATEDSVIRQAAAGK
jgi:HEAT repeat protein